MGNGLTSVEPIVIFGGSGQIGSAVVGGLIAAGHRVVSIDREPSNSLKEIVNAQSQLLQIPANVTNKVDLDKALEEVCEEFGMPIGMAYFIHYKGATQLKPGADFFSAFEDYPIHEWNLALEVNLTGLMLSCQVFGSAMAGRGRGSIVTVSSTYGLVGPDPSIYGGSGINSPVPYATSKAGIIGFTRYLAAYWGRSGVRTNCLVPGGVHHANQTEEFRNNYINRTTVGRMAEPVDYVGPTQFLLGDESRYMNGSLMVVDGGWTAI